MLTLIQAMQKHVAIVSISPSSVRGQGSGGVVARATEFLEVLPLQSFGSNTEVSFRKALDEATHELRASLPKPAQSWGLARKCLNIFLRDAFYNSLLAREYKLKLATPFYEVPLDSVVSRALRKYAPRHRLPAWVGVKYLSPTVSDAYQAFALELSREWGIKRVYLDTYLWVENREASGVHPM
jgi:hypothetical protein